MNRVVVVRQAPLSSAAEIGIGGYSAMLTYGISLLAGGTEIKSAVWKFLPKGAVGMKANCLTRKFNSTPVNLVDALSGILVSAGFEANELIIWDRTSHEVESAGFKLNASSYGRRAFGTDTNGFGYSAEIYSSGEVNSLVSRILTDEVASSINLPVLKDHSVAGLSGGLKNIYGVINNPNKYHDNNCDPYAAQILGLAPIKEKLKLTIIDAVRVQYNGGPGYDSRHLSNYGGIIVSDNPVAADAVALEILDHIRITNSLPTLEKSGRPVRYLGTAENLGYGAANLKNIELIVKKIESDGTLTDGSLF